MSYREFTQGIVARTLHVRFQRSINVILLFDCTRVSVVIIWLCIGIVFEFSRKCVNLKGIELLIEEVEKRAAIWNRALECYKFL